MPPKVAFREMGGNTNVINKYTWNKEYSYLSGQECVQERSP